MKHLYTLNCIGYETILHDLLLCDIFKWIYIHLHLYIIHSCLIVPQDLNNPLKQHFVRNDTSLVNSLSESES